MAFVSLSKTRLEVWKAIIKKASAVETAELVAKVEIIEYAKEEYETRKKALDKAYAQDIRAIKEELEKHLARCEHWSTTYHPDASGNNDSHTTCDICGKELK